MPCNSVILKSPNYQTGAAGDYHETGEMLNGRPVYKHDKQLLYLYFVSDRVKFWNIGPEVGAISGYFTARQDVDKPTDITLWLVYDCVYNTWVEDFEVQIYCKCDGEYIPLQFLRTHDDLIQGQQSVIGLHFLYILLKSP